MKRVIDAYRKQKKPRQRKYPREFVLAQRARWARRDTYKSLGRELGLNPKDLNYLLNAPLHVICEEYKSEEQQETNSQSLQMNGEQRFYVEPSGIADVR